MKIKNKTKKLYIALLLSCSFCTCSYGANGFDPSDWDDDYTETGKPVVIENENYGSPNYFALHIFPPKINPDWDPTDPDSPMWLYGPGSFNFDMTNFSDDTSIMAMDGGVSYALDNSSFNGTTMVSNAVYTGGEMFTADNSTFNDDTIVNTYASKATDGGVGTQINGSIFNDSTTFDVFDGGVLELNNSTVNLASDDLMSKYFGLSEDNPDSIFQRFYWTFISSSPLASSCFAWSSEPDAFKLANYVGLIFPKLGGFDNPDFDFSYIPDLPYYVLNPTNAVFYGNSSLGSMISGNLAYMGIYFLNPLIFNLTDYIVSDTNTYSKRLYIPDQTSDFTYLILFKTAQYTSSKVDERPVLIGKTVYCTLPALIDIQFKNLAALVTQVFNVFADWYYPNATTETLIELCRKERR